MNRKFITSIICIQIIVFSIIAIVFKTLEPLIYVMFSDVMSMIFATLEASVVILKRNRVRLSKYFSSWLKILTVLSVIIWMILQARIGNSMEAISNSTVAIVTAMINIVLTFIISSKMFNEEVK